MPPPRRFRKRQLRPIKANKPFDPQEFLANAGIGRTIRQCGPKQTIFAQGKTADAVYYIQEGRMRLSVISKLGKEATIALEGTGDFLGEEYGDLLNAGLSGMLMLSTPTVPVRMDRLRLPSVTGRPNAGRKRLTLIRKSNATKTTNDPRRTIPATFKLRFVVLVMLAKSSFWIVCINPVGFGPPW